MQRSDLEKRVGIAEKRARDLDATAAAAKEQARAAAGEFVALQTELDRVRWVEAQRELGIAAADIDADRGVVTTLPLGPTYGETG